MQKIMPNITVTIQAIYNKEKLLNAVINDKDTYKELSKQQQVELDTDITSNNVGNKCTWII